MVGSCFWPLLPYFVSVLSSTFWLAKVASWLSMCWLIVACPAIVEPIWAAIYACSLMALSRDLSPSILADSQINFK